jgi:hypothetical protein
MLLMGELQLRLGEVMLRLGEVMLRLGEPSIPSIAPPFRRKAQLRFPVEILSHATFGGLALATD